jgi:hypothetical protein
MAKQFVFTFVSRNPKGEIETHNAPAGSLQEAVAAYEGDGVVFAVYQNRNSAQSWLAQKD